MVVAATKELRTGPALQRAARAYAQEDRGRTWRLLFVTCVVLFGCEAVTALAPWWPVRIGAMVIAGLTSVRMFIFLHDHLHGAILRDSPVGKAIMWLYALYCLNPASVWRETHDYHHRNNAKMLGGSIGSFPVVTRRMWSAMKPGQRRLYKFVRHPLNMTFGYFTIFIGGLCLSSFMRRPKVHWQGPLAIVFHFGIAALVSYGTGEWYAGIMAVMVPQMIACGLGSYLFYAQHNFPEIQLRDRRNWDYQFAALNSSSMFDMNGVMHWFTGNIGYHHVHHLNHRIPFYRLPEAMEALPELQVPGRTSWRPRDIAACLALQVWDPRQKRMISFAELG
ncbi:MAG: omega-6 fatty acid desaturase (delta-12 desaturase) [Myxococcota bacterium]|jgi:omega-6 fatty acid desaturase (delta-12 desaturase)